jgi:TonB family protein
MCKGRFVIATAVLFLAASAMAQAQCTKPDAPLRPIMETHKLPPYPALSVMTNEQGISLLTVSIGTDGVPTDVQVVNSSGSLRLDEAARDFVKATWRWSPPTMACKPVAVLTRVSINWDLRDAPDDPNMRIPSITMTKADFPPGALERHEQGTTIVTMIASTTGNIVRPEVAQGSGFADLDSKALEIAKTRYRWTVAKMDETPINTRIFLAVNWSLANGP